MENSEQPGSGGRDDGPMPGPPALSELLIRWEQGRAQGREPTADELCADQPELRPEVERRIAALRAVFQVLATTPPTGVAPAQGVRPLAVPSVPGYDILELLGRGGMGVVYKARHRALNRLVALKFIGAAGPVPPEKHERFRREAEAIAQLQHPNIVQVVEVGDLGELPYLATEYCPGGSLAQKLNGTPWPPARAARLVEALAEGIHVAHEQRLVHRDLKPGNVLLGPGGVPKISDFGLAKWLDDSSGLTPTVVVLGTPCYMAPEQASGNSKQVGPAADIYALGAILYECLTGRPPFRGVTPTDTLHQVVHHHPVPPSRLQPGVPAKLDAICLHCLAKKPGRRYPEARALARDLARFQAAQPLTAATQGAPGPRWRWVRDHAGTGSVIAALACFLLATAILAGRFALRAGGEPVPAGGPTDHDPLPVETQHAELERARQEAARARARADCLAYVLKVESALKAWNSGREIMARQRLDETDAALRGWEFDYLHERFGVGRAGDGAHRRLFANPLAGLGCGAGGRWLVGATRDGEVRLWDLTQHREHRVLPRRDAALRGVAVSAQAPRVAAAYADGLIRLWSPGQQHGKDLQTTGPAPGALALSPDGRRLAVAGGRTLRQWDAVTLAPEPLWLGPTDKVLGLSHSPDGRQLAAATQQAVRLWDARTGRALRTIPASPQTGVVYSPDGRSLAAACTDGLVRLWDVASGDEMLAFPSHRAPVVGLAFSPDGRRLATAGAADVRLWDAGQAVCVLTLEVSAARVSGVAFSPNGRYLAALGSEGFVDVWGAGPWRP